MPKTVNRKKTLKELKQELEQRDAKVNELEQALAENVQYAGALMGGINERDRKLADLNTKYELQAQRLDIASKRQKIVEAEFQNKIHQLRLRNTYFENNLVKAAFKRSVFNLFKFVRSFLPLTESAKAKITSKLSGVAHILNADTHLKPVSNLSNIDFDIEFPECENPTVSILILVQGNISRTISTLKSILQQSCTFEYEVLIFDDASSDPFHRILQNIPGVKYIRNAEHLGFVANCNRNLENARGDYILFLSNDILLQPMCLNSMYETFVQQEKPGIVGGKLNNSEGTIASIGGSINDDAHIVNLGNAQDPAHPLFNYVRLVDCVTSKLFMIGIEDLKKLGGFTKGYTNSKYAVSDICLKLRNSGKNVIYQPKSSANEIESSLESENAELSESINTKQLSEMLHSYSKNSAKQVDNVSRGNVLYVDATTPEPDKDAGSINAVYSMKVMLDLGYKVHFIPGSNFAYWEKATENLQQMGVECIYHPFYSNMEIFLNERRDSLNYVVLSRAYCNEMFLKMVRKICPNAKIVYNTVDLHFLRMEREAKLHDNPETSLAAKKMREKELRFMRETDATILLSEFEHQTLAKIKTIKDKLWTIPLVLPKAERIAKFSDTKDFVFIGGYNHPPNVDAVDWLIQDVWPEMRKVLPGVKLIICGSSMPERFQDYVSEDVEIRGFVADLDKLMSQTRFTIAPLRFGAGLKGKVASSIGAGVPCIGTAIAFEGMAEEGLLDFKLEASTPEEFAALAASIYFNEEYWNAISKNGCAYYNNNFAYQGLAGKFSELFQSLQDNP